MTKITETAFEEIVITTLEKIAFLFMDPIPKEDAQPPKWDLKAKIQFEGPFSKGYALFSTDFAFAKEMAAGFLGIEPLDASEEDARSGIKELSNIIAGELILRLGAREDEFYLGLPELLDPNSGEMDEDAQGSLCFHFESDEGHLCCQVVIEEK